MYIVRFATSQLTILAAVNNTLHSSTDSSQRRRMMEQMPIGTFCKYYTFVRELSSIYRVLPYIIDLGSANGTYLNTERIEPQRYYELKEKDMLKFGFSSREYVLLHENSGE